VISVS